VTEPSAFLADTPRVVLHGQWSGAGQVCDIRSSSSARALRWVGRVLAVGRPPISASSPRFHSDGAGAYLVTDRSVYYFGGDGPVLV
jgi:hypothetical protein